MVFPDPPAWAIALFLGVPALALMGLGAALHALLF